MKKLGYMTLTLALAALLASCGTTALEETQTTPETGVGSCVLYPTPEEETETTVTETTTPAETRGSAPETVASPETDVTTKAQTAVTTTTTARMTTTARLPGVTVEPVVTLAPAPAPAVGTPISAILVYSYNAFAASSSYYGYTYYYYTPTLTERGQTYKTKIHIADPTATKNTVNVVTTIPAEGAFAALCEELYALGISDLPETVEVDQNRIIMDGSHRYIIFYFEDGTAYTSEGYCADSYSDHYKSVFERLTAYGTVG